LWPSAVKLLSIVPVFRGKKSTVAGAAELLVSGAKVRPHCPSSSEQEHRDDLQRSQRDEERQYQLRDVDYVVPDFPKKLHHTGNIAATMQADEHCQQFVGFRNRMGLRIVRCERCRRTRTGTGP